MQLILEKSRDFRILCSESKLFDEHYHRKNASELKSIESPVTTQILEQSEIHVHIRKVTMNHLSAVGYQ